MKPFCTGLFRIFGVTLLYFYICIPKVQAQTGLQHVNRAVSIWNFSPLTDSNKTMAKPVHSPKKATLYSTFLPGLGQAYNKKYYKIPIVYVGFGAFAYGIIETNKRYRTYVDAYLLRTDGNSSTIDDYENVFSVSDLFTLQAKYRRYRDLNIIGAILWYGVNILDANVDAHLFNFDVSDNLSLTPTYTPSFNSSTLTTFNSVSLRYKF